MNCGLRLHALVATSVILVSGLAACGKSGDESVQKPERQAATPQPVAKKPQPSRPKQYQPTGSDLMWERVDSGETKPEDGLITNLKILAGELTTDGVYGNDVKALGNVELLLNAAHHYLNHGKNKEAKEEIRRLLIKIRGDVDAIEKEAMSGPEQHSSIGVMFFAGLLESAIPSAHAAKDCSSMWNGAWPKPDPSSGKCALRYEWDYQGRHYRIIYPGQWALPEHEFEYSLVELTKDFTEITQERYSGLGQVGNARFMLGLVGSPEGKHAAAAVTNDPTTPSTYCKIDVYSRAEDQAFFSAVMAHELFHCFESLNMPVGWVGYSESASNHWWIEGAADFFADYAIPALTVESLNVADFDARSPDTPLYKLGYSSVYFFEFLFHEFGAQQIVDWLKTMPSGHAGYPAMMSALSKWGDMQDTFHRFGRTYLDNKIREASGNFIVMNPYPGDELAGATDPGFEVRAKPFVVHRAQYRFEKQNALTLITRKNEPPPGMYSVKKLTKEVVTNVAWGKLPARIPSPCGAFYDYQLLLTSVGVSNGDHELKVELKKDGDRAAPREIDVCLVGRWQVLPDSRKKVMKEMLERAVQVDLSVQDESWLCFDEAGSVEQQLSTKGHTKMFPKSGDTVEVRSENLASGGGEYEVKGNEIIIRAAGNISQVAHGWLNGEYMGGGPKAPPQGPGGDAYSAYAEFAKNCPPEWKCDESLEMMKKDPRFSAPKPAAPQTRTQGQARRYQCSGDKLKLYLPEPFTHLSLEYARAKAGDP